jgi:hypothetical protein
MIISIGKLVKKKSLTGVYVLAIQSKQSQITGVYVKKENGSGKQRETTKTMIAPFIYIYI